MNSYIDLLTFLLLMYVHFREHEHEVDNQRRRSKWSKAKNHHQNFSQWFETRVMKEDVPE